VLSVGAIGLWLYMKYVWYAGPTLAWKRDGKDYELLSPHARHRAARALFSLGHRQVAGGSSVAAANPLGGPARGLRGAPGLGLSRLARTATTQKIATVYIVDVSESVPDAAIEDARAEIQHAYDQKPEDGSSASSPSRSGPRC